ncbi:MAG: ribbon-helix-helix protein, CopG family [Patescibacteria group bacterium]
MITQILFNIDSDIKKKVALRAKREGISVSDVFKFAAREYAEEKIDIGVIQRTEIPNTRTAKRWAKIDEDIKKGKKLSPSFDNVYDFLADLEKEVALSRKKSR